VAPERGSPAAAVSDEAPLRSDGTDERSISDDEIASNEEQPSATDDSSQLPSRAASCAPPEPADAAAPVERAAERPPAKVSSMFSLLLDDESRPPPRAGAVTVRHTAAAAVVVKKSRQILDVLNSGTPPPTTEPPAAKRIAPIVQSRRAAAAKLPDWQIEFASAFLLTPDMSCVDDDAEQPDEVPPSAAPDADVITEENTRCICNSTHESEVMIQCDTCKKWLHENCVRLQNSREADPFICIFCQFQLAKAIKAYLRRKLAQFPIIFQNVENTYQPETGTHSMALWNQMLEVVQEAQSVLSLIPMILPSSEEPHAGDSPA
jgi:hypothetical protein